jgi:predicted nucleic acid-binding Zn ribbon protein
MKITEFKRNCPVCGKDVYHKTKNVLVVMIKRNSPCKLCLGKSQRKYQVESYRRICSECNKEIVYLNRKRYNAAVDKNCLCKSCSISIRGTPSEETKQKISEATVGKNRGKHPSLQSRKLMVLKQTGHRPYNTPEGIKKQRLSLRKTMAKKFLELGYRSPRVNPKGCRFIDIFSKINGYNFQHGANGGEVHFPETGTWVDGYDKERNVVFEYDEKKNITM